MHKIKTMGFDVFSDSLDKISLNENLLLSTISPNSYGLSTKDPLFRKSLINSDILVLDGVYFGLGHFLKTGKRLKRNQGPFVVNYFIEKAHRNNLKVFFMGSTEETLSKLDANLKIKYPNLKTANYSPPFKDEFSQEDNDEIIKVILNFDPDILFVGMTCPKQEKWSYSVKNNLNVKLICSVGAVFDWIAGNQKEIHPLWWKLRLAWLKRTIDRPEILKRYPMIFIYFKDMFMSLLKLNKIKL